MIDFLPFATWFFIQTFCKFSHALCWIFYFWYLGDFHRKLSVFALFQFALFHARYLHLLSSTLFLPVLLYRYHSRFIQNVFFWINTQCYICHSNNKWLGIECNFVHFIEIDLAFCFPFIVFILKRNEFILLSVKLIMFKNMFVNFHMNWT